MASSAAIYGAGWLVIASSGPWLPVEPGEIKKEIFPFREWNSNVTEPVLKSQKLLAACAIKENGEIVGYSLSCLSS